MEREVLKIPGAMRASAHIICSLVIGLWAGCGAAERPAPSPDDLQHLRVLELKVKAGFVYNFAKLTHWPDSAFPDAGTPLVIGVLGNDPLEATLVELLREKRIDGRQIVIRRFDRVSDIGDCHLLYIPAAQKERWPAVLAAVHNRSILTVSDINQFAANGGMIGLIKQSERLRFEINRPAAESAGLRLSSRLLGLAVTVLDDPERAERAP